MTEFSYSWEKGRQAEKNKKFLMGRQKIESEWNSDHRDTAGKSERMCCILGKNLIGLRGEKTKIDVHFFNKRERRCKP